MRPLQFHARQAETATVIAHYNYYFSIKLSIFYDLIHNFATRIAELNKLYEST